MTWKRIFLILANSFLMAPLMAVALEAPQETEATCAALGETACPGAVALLLAKKNINDNEIDRCTSFLVNSRTLVTNRHCIPLDLQDKAASCTGRLTAVFPKTSHFAAERAECESILNISAEAMDFPVGYMDYAVIRLKRPVKRPSFRISRKGIPNGMKLTTYSFDPVLGSPVKAVLRTKICESVQNTDLIPGYTDALSPVASFKGCQIIRGNSGSAAVDTEGRVRAIVHATWPLAKSYVPFSVMTNMACVELPSSFAPRDSRCNEKRPVNFDFKALYAKTPNLDFDSEFLAFQTANREQFRFKKSRLFANDRMVTIPDIECVQRTALNTVSSQTTVSVSLPIWGPEKFITANYRYEAAPSQFASAYTTLQFDTNELLAQGQTLAREVRGSYIIYLEQEYVLPLCRE